MSARARSRRAIVRTLLTSALSLVGAVGLQVRAGDVAGFATPVAGGPVAQQPAALTLLGGAAPSSAPTPGIRCDKASKPETVQGKAPKADYDSGRAAAGYTCNAKTISHRFQWGGSVSSATSTPPDASARTDSTLLWPHDVPDQGTEGPGLYVVAPGDLPTRCTPTRSAPRRRCSRRTSQSG